MSEVSLSWIPSLNRKLVIATFLVAGWILITLITATAAGIVNYEEVRYFHWIILLTLPVWILLESRSAPKQLNAKDEKRAVTAMTVTFVVFVIVALAAMLQGNI